MQQDVKRVLSARRLAWWPASTSNWEVRQGEDGCSAWLNVLARHAFCPSTRMVGMASCETNGGVLPGVTPGYGIALAGAPGVLRQDNRRVSSPPSTSAIPCLPNLPPASTPSREAEALSEGTGTTSPLLLYSSAYWAGLALQDEALPGVTSGRGTTLEGRVMGDDIKGTDRCLDKRGLCDPQVC